MACTRCAGKGTWLHGYRGDGIKAAKALQHKTVPGLDASRSAAAMTPLTGDLSPAKTPEIHVMDSVLSLDGTTGQEGALLDTPNGRQSANKERYLKKGLGTLSWLQKSTSAVSLNS